MLNSSFRILKGSKSSKKQSLFVLDDCLVAGQYVPNRFHKDWEHVVQELKEYVVRGKVKNVLMVDVSRTLEESKYLYDSTMTHFDAFGVEPQYISLGTFISVPPLLKILQVCAMMYNWISNGMKERECRVVLVLGTCDSVAMKTIALVVSSYWLFTSRYKTEMEALEHFMKKAKVYHNFSSTDVQLRIETSHVVRLLNCITQLKSTRDVPKQRLVKLKKTLIVGTVYLPGGRPWNPILRLYSGHDEYSEEYQTICQIRDSSQVGEGYASFMLSIPIYGDFTLSFEHWEEMAQHTIPIFTLFCHASFLTPSSRRFNRNEIEMYPELALGVDVESLEYIDLYFDELVEQQADENMAVALEVIDDEARTYLHEIEDMLQRAPEHPPKRRYLEKNYSSGAFIATLPWHSHDSRAESRGTADPLVKELTQHFRNRYYNESDNKGSRILLDSGRACAEFEMEWFYEAFSKYLDELSQYRNGYTEHDRRMAVKKALCSKFPATASLIESLDDHVLERALRKAMRDEESSYDTESEVDYSICSVNVDTQTSSRASRQEMMVDEGDGLLQQPSAHDWNEKWEDIKHNHSKDETIEEEWKRMEPQEEAVENKDGIPIASQPKEEKQKEETTNDGIETRLDCNTCPPPPPPPPPTSNWDSSTGNGAIPPPPPPPPPPPTNNTTPLSSSTTSTISIPNTPFGSQQKRRNVKQLHWNIVPRNKISKTIWGEGLTEEATQLAETVFTEPIVQELESMFSLKQNNNKSNLKKPEQDKNATTQGILEPKRATNIEIMLRHFSATPEDIVNAINELDTDSQVLSDENIVQLSLNGLQQDEIERAKSFTKDPECLNTPERFAFLLSKVPRIESKIRAALAIRNLDSSMEQVEKNIEKIQGACTEVKESKEWRQILKVVLVVGNFLNQATPRGQAMGFKLETLTKLQDTRATSDQQTTLLKYIVGLCKQKLGDTMDHCLEWKYVEDVSKMTQSEVSSDVLSLQNTLQSLKKEIEYFKSSDPAKWHKLHSFYESANERVVKLAEWHSRAIDDFRQLLTYFGENPNQTSLEDFFGTIYQFTVCFNRCWKEMDEERARRERSEEKTRRKQLHTRQPRNNNNNNNDSSVGLEKEQQPSDAVSSLQPVQRKLLFVEGNNNDDREKEVKNGVKETQVVSCDIPTVVKDTDDDDISDGTIQSKEAKKLAPVLSRVSSEAIPKVSELGFSSDKNPPKEQSSTASSLPRMTTTMESNTSANRTRSSSSVPKPNLFSNIRKLDAMLTSHHRHSKQPEEKESNVQRWFSAPKRH